MLCVSRARSRKWSARTSGSQGRRTCLVNTVRLSAPCLVRSHDSVHVCKSGRSSTSADGFPRTYISSGLACSRYCIVVNMRGECDDQGGRREYTEARALPEELSQRRPDERINTRPAHPHNTTPTGHATLKNECLHVCGDRCSSIYTVAAGMRRRCGGTRVLLAEGLGISSTSVCR